MSEQSLRFSKSDRMQQRAHQLIPGGCHTYAKGEDQYPVLAPGFIERGLGCRVWDIDGNEYIEYGMGNRSVGLGHAYPPVLRAVETALLGGSNFTRPARSEVDCAEAFLDLTGAQIGKVLQGRIGCDFRRRPPCARLHGPRSRRLLRRPSIFFNGRLVHRNHADECRYSGGGPKPHRYLPLQ